MLAGYYRPHLGLFIADMVAALMLAICDLFYPMITRTIINDLVPAGNLRMFLILGGVLLGIFLLKLGLNWFVMSWGHIMGARMQSDMRKDLFHHMQKLPFSYFDENQTGSLMSRIINDLQEITELAHHGPEDVFISLISFIGAFVILGRINLLLTCIIFVFLPFIILFTLMMKNRLQKAFGKRREKTAAINADISNSLSGIRVVKAFANDEYEEEKFGERSSELVEANAGAYHAMATYYSGMTFGIDLLTFTALVAAGIFVFNNQINIGDFAAYLLYIGNFTQPIRKLNQFMEQFQDGMSGFRRFAEVMDTAPEQNPALPESPKVMHGDIRFDDVSFTYGQKGAVLSHIDLHIPAGKTLALVGPSGGGKTTLCHLIPRFYAPQDGIITLDNIDVQKYDYTELRRSIGIVQQDVFIFAGTIQENIAYGDLSADEDAIVDAAIKAGLHDYIMEQPDGYNTYIGERGSKLSGGQKQRISIARVFLKNPPILILDEATSALDNVTELAIQRSFDQLAKNRTTLVVAHRLSTVRNADRIVVLGGEGIAEEGTHAELMAKPDGVYRMLYETQFSGLEDG
ncbi:ABC transporter ATP-binding protein/permease [Ruminococcaceae bacterium OttesenSCG-928-D13]|nr:ABC transporter ATP-binding protein/permease [Ruminococcaceae bacterium OttesenSCG-928-D13]